MDALRADDIHALLRAEHGPHVSIFLATHRAGPETQQDRIKLKNLRREADHRLRAAGADDKEIATILDPVQALEEDHAFWQHQSDGLALFSAPGRFSRYRLPLAFPDLAIVNNRFHVKPLLPLLAADGRFYVLAVSQNETRLLVGSRQSIQTLHVETMPESLADALKFEEPQRELQFHTGTAGRVGRRAAIFHGHGADDNEDDRILRYFRKIDRGLRSILREERVPLILAAVDEHVPLYQAANTYHHLHEQHIGGNPEHLRPDELHARAWSIVSDRFVEHQRRDAEHVVAAIAKGRGTGALNEALRAAIQGRIEMLFVSRSEQRWGSWDPATDVVNEHEQPDPLDEDLLDRAAVETLRNGGTVHVVEQDDVPGTGPVAAALRT